MPELSHIDPRSVALLVMDYQVDTLTRFMTAAQSADAIACVLDLIALARGAGMMVIHVVVAFRCGHPEVSPRNCGVDGVNSVGDWSLNEPRGWSWFRADWCGCATA
jgi:nicotinamidase-related amidase